MQPLNFRTRRLIGVLFLVLAIVIPTFIGIIAGTRALAISLSSVVILVIFGILFLSGRWPISATKK